MGPRDHTTVLLVVFTIAFASIAFFPNAVVDAEEVGGRQYCGLYLGESGDSSVLEPLTQGIQSASDSSNTLAARNGVIIDQVGVFGTWATPASGVSFSIKGDVLYSFWMSGDVDGAYLQLDLSVGTTTYTHTTESRDLDDIPFPFNGSFTLPGTLNGEPGDQIALDVKWGGGQDILTSMQNNTVTLWYGISSRASGVSVNINSVHIEETTSGPHPTKPDTMVFNTRATSVFGLNDMVEVVIIPSIFGGVLGEVQETVEGNYKVFSVEWDHSAVAFSEGGNFEVLVQIRDLSENWWEKSDSLAIIQADTEEVVDLSIVSSQVSFSPQNPMVGDEVNISVSFTGNGKNWLSVPVTIKLYDNNQSVVSLDRSASLGSNGPFTITWTPESPGQHHMLVALVENAIDAPGLNDENNVVEFPITVSVVAEDEKKEDEKTTMPFWTMLGIILIVVVGTAAAANSMISAHKKKQQLVDIPPTVGGGQVPIPRHAPPSGPQGFFVHSQGQPSMWVDTSSNKHR